MRLSKDGWTGLAVLAASLILFWLTIGLRDNPLVPIGPGFYPRIVLGISATLAAALLIFSFLEKKSAQPGGANYGLVVAIFAIFFVYVGALPYLGFRIATLLFVPALQLTLEWPKDRRGWIVVIVTAIVTTAVSYFLFERYLQVLLPRGRWTDF